MKHLLSFGLVILLAASQFGLTALSKITGAKVTEGVYDTRPEASCTVIRAKGEKNWIIYHILLIMIDGQLVHVSFHDPHINL